MQENMHYPNQKFSKTLHSAYTIRDLNRVVWIKKFSLCKTTLFKDLLYKRHWTAFSRVNINFKKSLLYMKNSFAIAALSLFNSAAAESDAIVPNFVMFGVIFTLHRHHKQTFKEKLVYVPTAIFCRRWHKLVRPWSSMPVIFFLSSRACWFDK